MSAFERKDGSVDEGHLTMRRRTDAKENRSAVIEERWDQCSVDKIWTHVSILKAKYGKRSPGRGGQRNPEE